jgi:hypothetical protein
MSGIDSLKRFVPVITFVAGSITIAVGAHKLVDTYSEPSPAYQLNSVRVVMNANRGKSYVRVDVIKLRPECRSVGAEIQIRLKDGSDRSYNLDMGGHLLPGPHVVFGIIEGPSMFDLDMSVPPKIQTTHDCGDGKPPVVSTCDGFFAGAKEVNCAEE